MRAPSPLKSAGVWPGSISHPRRSHPSGGYVKTSSDVWGKVSNYANGLKFTYGDDGLTISNNTGGKDCDTAWGLTSKPLILPKDVSAFTLAVTMRSAQKFFDAKGGDSYSNKIRWMDDEGNEVCPSTQLKFDTQAGRFITTTLSGLIPVNATRAVLSLGADSPNIIAAAESMTLRDVSFRSTILKTRHTRHPAQ